MDTKIYFHGGILNAVDAKGRVSLPIQLRKVIEKRSRAAFPEGEEDKSLKIAVLEKKGCLRAFDQSYSAKLHDVIEQQVARLDLDPMDALEAIEEASVKAFGSSGDVPYDSVGRMVLPQWLRDAAGIADYALFVGAGDTIQIWDPERFRAACPEMRDVITQIDHQLPERAK